MGTPRSLCSLLLWQCTPVSLCVCESELLLWYTAHHCYSNAPKGGSVCSVWLMRQFPTSSGIASSWGWMAAEKAALLLSTFYSSVFPAVLSFWLLGSYGFSWHHLVTTFLSFSPRLFFALSSIHLFSAISIHLYILPSEPGEQVQRHQHK